MSGIPTAQRTPAVNTETTESDFESTDKRQFLVQAGNGQPLCRSRSRIRKFITHREIDMKIRFIIAVAALAWSTANAQVTTAFTYQGELEQSGTPASGDYDFEFRLYDMQTGGAQVAGAISVADLFVDGGLFSVELDFGNVYGLADLWLDVRVRDGASGGSFTPLLPRQKITPAPIALNAQSVEPGVVGSAEIIDGSVGADDIDPAEVQARVNGSCSSGEAIGAIAANGSVTCTASGASGSSWSLSGNAISAGSFLGTTNAEPLELRAADSRVFEALDANDDGSHAPNIVLGSDQNVVAATVHGATVSGGGGGFPNRATGNYATVVGGVGNTASGTASIAGGRSAMAEGFSAVALGQSAIAAETRSFAVHGRALGRHSVSLGQDSTALGEWAFATGPFSVANGRFSTAIGREAFADAESAIALGFSTTASGIESFAAGSNTTASGDFSTALGSDNEASGATSTVLGVLTSASGSVSLATGFDSDAAGATSTAMGLSTSASGVAAMAVNEDTEAGGDSSLAAGRNVRVRGADLTGETDIDGSCIAPVGGCGDEGTFIWGDSQNVTTTSTAPDQFLIRARGGVGIGTNAPRNQLDVRRTSKGAALNANHVAVIENEATNNGHVLALKSNTATPGSDENFITFKASGSNVGAIEGDGSGGVTMVSGGADFAELLPVRVDSEMPRPGDVVGVIDGRISLDTRGANQLMVVSTQPIIVGNAPGGERTAGSLPVAFLGQVPVRVRGPVSAGDLLVASGKSDGHALAVDRSAWNPAQHGPVIGQAWESSDGQAPTRIRAAIGIGQAAAAERALRRQQAVILSQAHRIESLEARFQALETRLDRRYGDRPAVRATAAE